MILDKTVKVRTIGKSIKYYRDLGYECAHNTEIEVKIGDLQKWSHALINAACDYCGCNVIIPYANYNKSCKTLNKYSCDNCKSEKEKELFLQKYGVSSPMKLDEIKEKIYETNMRRYGVKHALQSESHIQKRNKTCLERYGTTSPISLDCFKEKSKQSYLERYGVDSPLKSPEIRKKLAQSFYKNSSQKASSQQRHLHNLYGGELNYPISYYNADICLPKENITIEYNGGGHMLNVITGKETQEEYNQKEIVRNNIIKRAGFKQITIVSSKDLLPSDEILLKILEQSKEYFNTTDHTWVEYNIDTSLMRNAENKEGVFFDFGELRKIKKTG